MVRLEGSAGSRRLRVGWFSTGRGPGSRALLTAAVQSIVAGALSADIAFVFCNRDRGQDPATDQLLDLAAGYGLPVITFSDRAFRKRAGGTVARSGQPLPAWRADYDREMLARIAPFAVDVCVLAGYMLILSPETTAAAPFLNLHPAAPGGPKGIWQDVIWQLIDARATESGVLLQVATPDLDEGPVVSFCRYAIRGPAFDQRWRDVGSRSAAEVRAAEGEDNALFRAIRRHGAAREIPLILRTLAALAGERIRIAPGRVLSTDGPQPAPLDLTREVDADVAATGIAEA